ISHPPPITGQNFPADFYLTWSAGSHKIQLPKVFGGVAIPSNLILPSNIPLVEQGKGCSPFGVRLSICGAGLQACAGPPGPALAGSEARHRRARRPLLNGTEAPTHPP